MLKLRRDFLFWFVDFNRVVSNMASVIVMFDSKGKKKTTVNVCQQSRLARVQTVAVGPKKD